MEFVDFLFFTGGASNTFLTGRNKRVWLFVVNNLPGFCTSSLSVLGILWNINQLSINKGSVCCEVHSQNVSAKWFYEGMFRDKDHVMRKAQHASKQDVVFILIFLYFFLQGIKRQFCFHNLKCLSTFKVKETIITVL